MKQYKHKFKKHIPTITHLDFQAFNADGSPKKGVIKAFLKTVNLDIEDMLAGKIKVEEYELQLVLHPDIVDMFKRERTIRVLLSCQFREYGHYAIAVLFKKPQDAMDN